MPTWCREGKWWIVFLHTVRRAGRIAWDLVLDFLVFLPPLCSFPSSSSSLVFTLKEMPLVVVSLVQKWPRWSLLLRQHLLPCHKALLALQMWVFQTAPALWHHSWCWQLLMETELFLGPWEGGGSGEQTWSSPGFVCVRHPQKGNVCVGHFQWNVGSENTQGKFWAC